MLLTLSIDASDVISRIGRLVAALDAGDEPGTQQGLWDAGDVYLAAMRARYDGASQGDGTWPPLTDKRIQRKRELGLLEPETILVAYGDMYGSLNPGHQDNIMQLGANEITVGTSDPKASLHQEGFGNTPARPILVEPDSTAANDMLEQLGIGTAKTMLDILGPP